MKKLKVNPDTCIGCGSCISVASKSFKLTQDGKSIPLDPIGDNEKTVKEAIDICPVDAISWEE